MTNITVYDNLRQRGFVVEDFRVVDTFVVNSLEEFNVNTLRVAGTMVVGGVVRVFDKVIFEGGKIIYELNSKVVIYG